MRAHRFGSVARRQQAAFRMTLSPSARAPTDDKGMRHEHLLALGHEDENLYPTLRGRAGAKLFFAQRGIHWWNNIRSGDRKRAKNDQGPTRNAASSQVCCVNFLLPLAHDAEALTEFLRSIDSDVVAVEPIRHGGNESLVEFEWVGWDRPLEGGRPSRGAYQTSIDALMVARTTTGRRAYLLEWKYCEEYLRPDDKGAGSSGETRRSRYQNLYTDPASAFNLTLPFDEWLYEPFYQIMRTLLLSDRMLSQGVTEGSPVDDARMAVICPDANVDYLRLVPSTPFGDRFNGVGTLEEVVKTGLKDPSRFSIMGQERIVETLRSRLSGTDFRDWADYHRLRYDW